MKPSMVMHRARAGKTSWNGKERILLIPSEARTPQLAMGADTPRPMKLRKASVKIASGMDKVRVTIIGPTQLGII